VCWCIPCGEQGRVPKGEEFLTKADSSFKGPLQLLAKRESDVKARFEGGRKGYQVIKRGRKNIGDRRKEEHRNLRGCRQRGKRKRTKFLAKSA